MRSVPLIERKADARRLQEEIGAHEADCRHCRSTAIRGKCDVQKAAARQLKAIRHEIAHWFDPPADAETLF